MMPMMASTKSNSMRVKPDCLFISVSLPVGEPELKQMKCQKMVDAGTSRYLILERQLWKGRWKYATS
jgi:hypothetical protein